MKAIGQELGGATDADSRKTPTTAWLLQLSSYWFATSFKWFLVLVFLLPDQVAGLIPGGAKSSYWGAVFGIGATWAIIGPAIFGDVSDRAGDRRPFIIGGSLATVGALAILFHARSIWALAAGYLVLQVADDLATGPYSATVPDLVPTESRGRASGLMGLAMSLGQVTAVAASLLLVGAKLPLYVVIGGMNLIAAFAVIRLFGRNVSRKVEKGNVVGAWLEPWKRRDFRSVWLSRFFPTLGLYFVIPYANFYIRDTMPEAQLYGWQIGNGDIATGVLALTIALASGVSAAVGGVAVDRFGRKFVTYAGLTAMALALASNVFTQSYTGLWLLALVMGSGNGAFQAANWAMASDVLPERSSLGRDMGLWQSSISSVQVIAGLAGTLITFGNRLAPGLGYRMIFLLAAFAVTLGLFFTRQVKAST